MLQIYFRSNCPGGATLPALVHANERLFFGKGLQSNVSLTHAGVCTLQIGKTRVFLRAGQLAQLEGARGRRLTASALIIQAAFRWAISSYSPAGSRCALALSTCNAQ